MKKGTVIAIRIAYALVILGLALLALPAIIPPRRSAAVQQNEPERDMLGWPVREVTPAERRRNLDRALAALRQATAEHETRVAALRERLTSATAPQTVAAELAHQEKILAVLRKRLEEEEDANRVAGD